MAFCKPTYALFFEPMLRAQSNILSNVISEPRKESEMFGRIVGFATWMGPEWLSFSEVNINELKSY